jgi:hypothetical protein
MLAGVEVAGRASHTSIALASSTHAVSLTSVACMLPRLRCVGFLDHAQRLDHAAGLVEWSAAYEVGRLAGRARTGCIRGPGERHIDCLLDRSPQAGEPYG